MIEEILSRHFKNEDTRKLVREIITLSVSFIVLLGILIILARLYLPPGILSSFDLSGFLEYGYAGIFLATLLGGTVLPLGTPALIAAASAIGFPETPLIIISTIGATIGVFINYGLGYYLGTHYVKRKLGEGVYEDLSEWWNKWGVGLAIVFALVPVLPFDMLALLCGLFRLHLFQFTVLNVVSNLTKAYIFVYLGASAAVWIGLI